MTQNMSAKGLHLVQYKNLKLSENLCRSTKITRVLDVIWVPQFSKNVFCLFRVQSKLVLSNDRRYQGTYNIFKSYGRMVLGHDG